ncbi:MAG: UPF0182 family protein [Clostridia bacterium]|nr:UPF0182 family protein [Clostridia bacterium]
MNKAKKAVMFTGIFIIVAIAIFVSIAGIIADFKWLVKLGYEVVFWTDLKAKTILWAVCFVVFFILTYINFIYVKKNTEDRLEQDNPWNKITRVGVPVISLLVSVVVGFIVSRNLWVQYLEYFNATNFQISDPLFAKDISYYIFKRPFLYNVLNVILIYMFFLTVFIGLIYFIKGVLVDQRYPKIHLSILVSIILALLAISYKFRIEGLLFSTKGKVFGAGYTDVFLTLNYYKVQIVVIVIAIVLTIYMAVKGKVGRHIFSGIILYFSVAILGSVAVFIVQQYVVLPNELSKESKFIEYNIDYTKKAFGLDNIKEIEFPDNDTLDRDMVKRNQDAINNIRINDYKAALAAYNQLQGIRKYYRFTDIDVDRYHIDGEKTQVFISARELDKNQINNTHVNNVYKFTHGMGVSVSSVNEVTSEGQPNFIVRDIPPQSIVKELNVEQPRIYYGELTDDYVVVNAGIKEFDYPSGDKNVENIYDGDGGIPLKGINRLIYGLDRRSFKLFISSYVTSDSKIMLHRNIRKRVNRIAPFIEVDEDPYIIIADGKLYWIIDGYTTSDQYPYSQPIIRENDYINYIRNSVKVVVDAYNGDVDFYISDVDDPIINTYSNIYPGLFKQMEQMPEEIKAHIRYPEYYFNIQTARYNKYHMNDITVFYNEEDVWRFALEKYWNEKVEVQPYYMMVNLPGQDDVEFVLARSFTPVNKDNAIALMMARNDGDNYGQLCAYKFPKQKKVYGPLQVEARIDQDTNISSQLSLWDQRGSDVIRGNMLMIPIEDTVLYVEPLYIQSDAGNSLPEVKRIIVSYKDRIAMEKDLKTALEKVLVTTAEMDQDKAEQETVEELIKKAANTLEEIKSSSGQGEWAEFGQKLEELERIIKQLNE